jgi:hypothetical protein
MFYFAYEGNKRKEIKEIEEDIIQMIDKGKIKKIVEPFCGSCALSVFLYNKFGDKLEYHLNDIDHFLMEFLTDIKNGNGDKYFQFINNECKNLTKDRFDEIINKGYPTNSIHYIFMKKVYGMYPGRFPKYRKYGNYKWEKYEKLDKFFQNKKTFLYTGNYCHIFKKFENDEASLIFLDPPYFSSYNKQYISFSKGHYDDNDNSIDNTNMYIDIAELFQKKAKICAILNSVGILKYIYNDFYKRDFDKKYSIAKKLKTKGWTKTKTQHSIFSNY